MVQAEKSVGVFNNCFFLIFAPKQMTLIKSYCICLHLIADIKKNY